MVWNNNELKILNKVKVIIYKFLSKLGYRIENKKKQVLIKKKNVSGFDVTKNINLLIKSHDFIQNLIKKYPNLWLSDYEKGVLVEFDSLKIYVETFEEFFILDEVFVQNIYNFSSNDKVILIDIGANIGTTCLFFSKLPNVEKIYAFEPVPITFQQATLNLGLNKEISKVVEIKNIGLGKNDREEIFLFNQNVKGNTGLRGDLSASFKEDEVVEIAVAIKDASISIREIIAANPQCKVVLKMDCEGGEYEIFENLASSGVIEQIDYIMMEWHDRGEDILEEILRNNGFMYFSQRLAFNAGMIYAVKQ